MCGVAGIVGHDSPENVVLSAAQKMVSAMRHRGPDGCGVTSLPGCVLANTRLAIVDLSDRGRQPMSNADRTIWISYNGETYNAAELRQELIDKGYSFRSKTDTEVVLRLYEECGAECIRKLRGMFALAIWDTRTQKLLLARDRLGIKPLYFFRRNGTLIFGSELKCLLASGLIERRIETSALPLYLQLGHVPPPWSLISGVMPLPPGNVAIWQDGTFTGGPYWSLDSLGYESGHENHPVPQAAEQLGDVLLDAMQKSLISDAPSAIFLSGGVDSACLGALARAAGGGDIPAVTLGFSEPDFDETELGRQTAVALGLPFHPVLLTPERVAREIDACIWAMDQPTVDGVNSYWISKIGAERGFKVALSGQGGDELFGGYTSWKWFRLFAAIAAWSRHLPRQCARPFDREQRSFRWRKLSYLFGDCDPLLASQMAVKILFLEADVARLLSSALGLDSAPGAREYLQTCASRLGRRDGQAMLALMDICTHLQPRLLRDLDAMSMAHGLEVRPVFLDDRVVEFALALPASARQHPKKLLLESMKRFMPPDLLAALKTRAKRTFTFPFAKWLAQDLNTAIEETFSPSRLEPAGILNATEVARVWKKFKASPRTVGWSRIWSLFVLARWCQSMDVHA